MRFLCQASIEQDSFGNVREVALDHCNGTPAWQRSLVDAIKSASPLPAPADPAVFSPKIQMAFHEDAIEGEVTTTEALGSVAALKPSFESAMATSLAALRQIRDTSARSGATSVIDLRIEGRSNHEQPMSSMREPQSSERFRTDPLDGGEKPSQQQ